jgi:hypothetical protein
VINRALDRIGPFPVADRGALERRRGDESFRANVFRDEVGVLPEAIAGALDLDDDGVVEQAVCFSTEAEPFPDLADPIDIKPEIRISGGPNRR